MNRSLRRVRHRLPTCPHIDNEDSAFAFGFQFQFPSVSLKAQICDFLCEKCVDSLKYICTF